ncbi:MAG: replicative DNA helicase [Coriobacteriia bacterium]|nr:replicative DNA helicase [Coriobacteriia bacterium]
MADFIGSNAAMQDMALRVMPQNLEAEASVLAALMISPDVVMDILGRLKAEDFYRPANRKVFEAISELAARNTPIDQISVADRLQARGDLDEVGGKAYLVDLASNSFALVNWSHHATMVKRNAVLRDLIGASTRITALAFEAPDDLDEVVEESEKLLLEVTNRKIESNFRPLEELLRETYEDIEHLAEHPDHIIGVPTGFIDVDKKLAGLRPGNLVILAARPAVGKTSLALNMAINAAKEGVSVAFFSLEMSASELTQIVLCSEASVNLRDIRTGQLKASDWTQLISASQTLAALDFWVDDTPGTSIMEIRAKARRQLLGKEKGLVVLDYLQLMNPQGRARSENRNVEVGEMSRGLKILAKDLNMPVIALSQLSRAVESRSDKRPMLSDLRESGSIEQDADIVMFLDRSTSEEEAARDNRPDLNMANLIIAKNRSGATADIPLVFLGQYTKFTDFARDYA